MSRIAVAILLCGCKAEHRDQETFDESVELTKLDVAKYMWEAYPSWQRAHPRKDCPTLEELNEYLDKTSLKDRWGHRYKLLCGDRVPPVGQRYRLAVLSLGPDGSEGTADDIRSWDSRDER